MSAPQRLAKAARHVKGIEHDDAAHPRVDPEQLRVVAILGHGKDADGVGLQQHIRSKVRHLHGDVSEIARSEEHTSELQSLMRISYAVFCLKKKTQPDHTHDDHTKTNTRITD